LALSIYDTCLFRNIEKINSDPNKINCIVIKADCNLTFPLWLLTADLKILTFKRINGKIIPNINPVSNMMPKADTELDTESSSPGICR
jgi:hypothetical protein